MNILDQEDMVKGMPDEVLIAQSQNPTGGIPQFLLVSEIQRREKMRASYQGEQQQMPMPTVADQVVQQGIASLNPAPDPLMNTAMGAPQQPMMSQQPMMMAAGGGMMPYRMAPGRDIPFPEDFFNLPLSALGGTAEAIAQMRGYDNEYVQRLLSEYAKRKDLDVTSILDQFTPAPLQQFSSSAAQEDAAKITPEQVTPELIELASAPNTADASIDTSNPQLEGALLAADQKRKERMYPTPIRDAINQRLANITKDDFDFRPDFLKTTTPITDLINKFSQDRSTAPAPEMSGVELMEQNIANQSAMSKRPLSGSGSIVPFGVLRSDADPIDVPPARLGQIEGFLQAVEDRRNFPKLQEQSKADDKLQNMARGVREEIFHRYGDDAINRPELPVENRTQDKARFEAARNYARNKLIQKSIQRQFEEDPIKATEKYSTGVLQSNINPETPMYAVAPGGGAFPIGPASPEEELQKRRENLVDGTVLRPEIAEGVGGLFRRGLDYFNIKPGSFYDNFGNQASTSKTTAKFVDAKDDTDPSSATKDPEPITDATDEDVVDTSKKDSKARPTTIVKAAEETAKTGDTSKEDLESVIASMFGRSYKPTDEGALALINLGAGIAKGDLGAGLAGAGQAIVGERDRRRKDMLAAAQARYYLTAGERANKLSYQDVLETATKQYDDMSYRQKQALYRQQYGKDPAQGDLDAARGNLIALLAQRVAVREGTSAYAGGDPLATSRAIPPDPTDRDAKIKLLNSTLGYLGSST